MRVALYIFAAAGPRKRQGGLSDGVLEVSVPLSARPEANGGSVQIEEPKTTAKSAA